MRILESDVRAWTLTCEKILSNKGRRKRAYIMFEAESAGEQDQSWRR